MLNDMIDKRLMKIRLSLGSALILIIGFLACLSTEFKVQEETGSGIGRGGDEGPVTRKDDIGVPDSQMGSDSGSLGSWSWGMTSWIVNNQDAEYVQEYSVVDFREVIARERFTDKALGTTTAVESSGSSSFNIFATASARKDLFAFAGFARNQELVLEVWQLLEPTAIPIVLGAGGLAQPAIPDGLVPKRFQKTEIYRGSVANEIVDMDFDDDGRFVFALLKNMGSVFLYKFDTDGVLPPQLLYDTLSLPELATMARIEKYQHGVLGRIWAMVDNKMPFSMQIVLMDTDNDGAFDGAPILGDYAFYKAAGLEEYELWDPLSGPVD